MTRADRDAIECVCAELVSAGCVIEPDQLAEAYQEINRIKATDRARDDVRAWGVQAAAGRARVEASDKARVWIQAKRG